MATLRVSDRSGKPESADLKVKEYTVQTADGAIYKFDLTPDERDEFTEYVLKFAKDPEAVRATKKGGGRGGAASGGSDDEYTKEEKDAARAWARERETKAGVPLFGEKPVGDRGRLATKVIEAWKEAQAS